MKRIVSLSLILVITGITMAQSSYQKELEAFKKKQQAEYSQYKKDRQAEYDAYRKQINDEYAEFMKHRWEEMQGKPAEKPKKEPEVKPVIYVEPTPEPVVEPTPEPAPEPKVEPKVEPKEEPKVEPKEEPKVEPRVVPKELPIKPEVVVIPVPAPAPKPIAPVQPKEGKQPLKKTSISFYGSLLSVNFPEPDKFKLTNLDESTLADAWKQLADKKYDVVLSNLLTIREEMKLVDWGYLRLVQEITKKHYGATNEATFMQAYLMTQSGYKVRLAKSQDTLYMLVTCSYTLVGRKYFILDGEPFYTLDNDVSKLQICPATVKDEQPLSIQISALQALNKELSDKRTLRSKKGVSVSVSVNKNEIDFYEQYPCGYLGKKPWSDVAVYANTPLDTTIQEQLYPAFQKMIQKMNQKDAANILLNWVQTAFEYECDDKVWGVERAFFPAETLFYPYCDCEDRSILFSRLMRDLLHLDVVLIYYPGHLATAVHFTEDVKGDYITYDGKKYVVCDPTYIGAPIGETMPGMDNQTAEVIVLQK